MTAEVAISQAVSTLAAVLVLVLIAGQARGRKRVAGVLGAGLVLLAALASATFSLSFDYLFDTLRLPVSLYALINLPVVVLRTAGIILVAIAVTIRSPARPDPSRWTPGRP